MDKIDLVLNHGVEDVIDKVSLKKKLEGSKKLVVKLGIDPTTPHLHLGHAVVLMKLKQFQDLGHQAVLVIGDFTAQVGDPSGRDSQRPVLTPSEIASNWQTYRKQASKILDMVKVKIVHNSAWFKKMGVAGLFDLLGKATINQLLERKDFADRLRQDKSLTYLEMLYPLLQGYDSVELKADVELGGVDQLFNLLMGRQLQKRYGQEEQDILMTPLLVGLDGKDKMSKSAGNYIGLTESPEEMFGKVMKVPDTLLQTYFELATSLNPEEVKFELKKGPYEAKKRLAEEIVTRYHGPKPSEEAREEFGRVFSQKESPSKLEVVTVDSQPTSYVSLTASAFGISRSEARRLIDQKALEDTGRLILNPEEEVEPHEDQILKLGKHRFAKIKVK